jgi:hypothetical protein
LSAAPQAAGLSDAPQAAGLSAAPQAEVGAAFSLPQPNRFLSPISNTLLIMIFRTSCRPHSCIL